MMARVSAVGWFGRCLAVAGAVAVIGVVSAGLPTIAAAQGTAQLSALKDHDTVQPIDITADRFEVHDQERIAVFFGSVEAAQGDLNIFSDTLTVYYETAKGTANPTITRLDVSGGVRVVSPSETVNADWVVYDVVERLLTLGGAVQLNRGDSEMRGERLELDLESGIVKFDSATGEGAQPGRVRGRFTVPEDDRN